MGRIQKLYRGMLWFIIMVVPPWSVMLSRKCYAFRQKPISSLPVSDLAYSTDMGLMLRLDVFYSSCQCSLVSNLLNQLIRLLQLLVYSNNQQDKLGPERLYKDGRQTPDWCIENICIRPLPTQHTWG